MAGGVKLQWKDRNFIETNHVVYRSDTPMDINSLPTPITTLGSNVTEYIDYDIIEGNTYYYRIGTVRGIDIEVSDEWEVYASATVRTTDYDAFGDDSIVAMFNFDNNSADLIGNSTLTMKQHPYVAGKFGTCIDMSTPITGLSDITGLESLKYNDYSISVWLNLNNISQPNGYILTYSTGGSSFQYVLLRIFENKINVYDNSVSYYSIGVLPLTGWNHVVVTYDSDNGRISIYINGVFDSQHNIITFNQPFDLMYFGSWRTGDYRYTGLLDHLRIFSKTLTQSECNMLFNEIEDV